MQMIEIFDYYSTSVNRPMQTYALAYHSNWPHYLHCSKFTQL